MNSIKDLIHEIHRRSLWQVLGIFLAASWGVLQVVQGVTDSVGLPDWTPSMAFVLLLLGLPVVLATAFVQEGMPGGGRSESVERGDAAAGSDDSAGEPMAEVPTAAGGAQAEPGGLLTWRNAILGGLGAFTLLGMSLVAYFVMWSSGIGPVGNLVAQGVIEDGVRVVLADFEDSTGEGLGEVVTEALRVDLTAAAVLALTDPAAFAGTLERMQIESGRAFDADLALEVAVRDGLGAVLDGAIAPVGDGYLITATLRESGTGAALSTFRSQASTSAELIGSIDKLSQDIRERSGESLREIKQGEPLEQVTTSSLEALRLYSEADEEFGRDDLRAIELLERAVEIDPEFAMAWRKLAAGYNNEISRRPDMAGAATRAYEHRERLTPRERYLAEAMYYQQVTRDAPRAADAYRGVLEVDPDNPTALNNLANAYNTMGDREAATELYRRAISGPGRTVTAYSNLILGELSLGEVEAAAEALAGMEAVYPDGGDNALARFHVLLMSDATSRAEEFALAALNDPQRSSAERSLAAQWMAKLSYRTGRVSEGRVYIERAATIAAQTSESFRATRYFTGLYYEAFLGEPERARELAIRLARMEGFSPLPTPQKSIVAWAAAFAGDPDVADEILNGVHGPINAEVDWPDRVRVLVKGLRGDTDGLVAELESLRDVWGCLGEICWILERALAAELSGEPQRAIELYEVRSRQSGTAWPIVGVDDVFSDIRLGPLYEEVGDSAKAIETYERLIELWSEGDAIGQERVRDIRTRIAALGG